jgi:hypothetical protein
MDRPVDQRHVGPLLATAIVAVPVLFTWLLLRKGYAPSTRRAGFVYMGAMVLLYVIAGLLLGG